MPVTTEGFDWEGALEHIGLARRIANRLARRSTIDIDDLTQVALMAFARALPKHNPRLGSVSTYIGRAAEFSIYALENELIPAVRVPIRFQGEMAPLRPKRAPLETDLEDDDASLDVERSEVVERVRSALSDLTPRHRSVLRAYYGIGCDSCSSREIAERRGTSRQAVHELLKTARDRLARALTR